MDQEAHHGVCLLIKPIENYAMQHPPFSGGEEDNMNAIVTVIGQDRVGIIAAVCGKLAELNVNILDITQTILKGNFTMVMTVDAGQANVGFDQLAAGLEALGEQMHLAIRIQREEIFDAMHRI